MIHNKQNFKTKLELILSWIGAVGITLKNQGLQGTDFHSIRRPTPNDEAFHAAWSTKMSHMVFTEGQLRLKDEV